MIDWFKCNFLKEKVQLYDIFSYVKAKKNKRKKKSRENTRKQ